MKYLPALGFGILLALLSFISFSLVASVGYMLDMLSAVPHISHNSVEYLLLAAHDASLLILLAGLVLYAYHRIFPKLPFDWFTAVLIQMPLGLAVLVLDGFTLNLFSFKGFALTLTTLAASFGVLSLFWLLQRRAKRFEARLSK
ncbi:MULTISPECIES: hypothetical protein [unclassified Shewanella]|uniref:hypothetical protein n=1 Tax=Shewanella TaxID=22 RepID=UPI000E9B4C78|nr:MULTISPECIES: hypothetical protein [unclassified Shewanella]MBP6517787.1 hypothetical protein [Shewanella sp.]MCU7986505.1 hypothetical protein [Shewanella sp. SW24]MCU8084560.1 hypothetical protein [Shewanella sp. SM23]HAY92397.1 hypothetical protein [Shewanella sp.]